jgi:hypothetical protein
MNETGTTGGLERGGVPLGPFDDDPFDLLPHVCLRADGQWRGGAEIREQSRAWLSAALTAAGVVLGEHDRRIVDLIAEDGWPTVQVVAGWITRASVAGSGASRPSRSALPIGRRAV